MRSTQLPASGFAGGLVADVVSASRCETHGAYTVGRLHRPGDRISPDRQTELLEVIAEVTSEAHHQPMQHYWSKKTDYFTTLDDWWFALHSDRFVGWCGARVWDTPHGTVMTPENSTVDRRHLRARLGVLLFIRAWLAASRTARRPLPLVAQTSSPIVYQMAMSLFGADRIVPAIQAPGDPAIERRVSPLMEYVAKQWYPSATYDREHSVVVAALPYAFYKRRPLSPYVALNRYFTEHLRIVPGDALILGAQPSPRMLLSGALAARKLTRDLAG